MNVGSLVDTFVPAYGIPSIIVSTDIRLFLHQLIRLSSQPTSLHTPVIPPQPAPEPSTSSVPPAAIGKLQSQLQETQSALASYSDKFHILDSLIAEHNGFKHDVDLIKGFIEEYKREAQAREQHNKEFSSNNDNAHSVDTIS